MGAAVFRRSQIAQDGAALIGRFLQHLGWDHASMIEPPGWFG